MAGRVRVEQHGAWAQVLLENPGKFNAMSRSMWQDLRAVFEALQHQQGLRCIVVSGLSDQFCSGGDIAEYPSFRFNAESLRAFHEDEVWGALQAMLDCDVPMLARIQGNCMGAGMEIASCCDIRLGAESSRYGAPIARLGFAMAAREAALVARAVGESVARAMLLGAEILDSQRMYQSGFLLHRVADHGLEAATTALLERMLQLAPLAARAQKQLLRALNAPLAQVKQAQLATTSIAIEGLDAFRYANSAEHREGICAFLQKRPPEF